MEFFEKYIEKEQNDTFNFSFLNVHNQKTKRHNMIALYLLYWHPYFNMCIESSREYDKNIFVSRITKNHAIG